MHPLSSAEAARGGGFAVAGVLGGYGGGGGTGSSGRRLGMAVEVVVMAECGVEVYLMAG
jgi:hypothetical protein